MSALENQIRTGIVVSCDAANNSVTVQWAQGNLSAPLGVIFPFVGIEAEATEMTYGEHTRSHTHRVKFVPRYPEPGQAVICLMPPNEKGMGFVIGGFNLGAELVGEGAVLP